MNESPLISIIFPIYNTSEFLKFSLNSIFCQTVKDWELILIDDCSTDNSFEIISRLNDERITILRNNKNYGHSFSCNRGIEIAKGKYIARMDADDICFPDRFEKQLEYMINHPEVDVISCGSIKMTKNLDKILNVDFPSSSHKEITKLFWKNKQLLFGTNIWITDGALFAKKEWFKKWKYDVNIPFAQDFDLMFKAQFESLYGNVNELLYIYRKSGVTSTYLNQLKSVYYKSMTLIKYGFVNKSWSKSLIGLFVNFIRIFSSFAINTFQKYIKINFYKNDFQLEKKIRNLIEFLDSV